MDVRRPPGIVVVAPGIGAGLDGDELVVAVGIGAGAAAAVEIRIERRIVLVAGMMVAARRVRSFSPESSRSSFSSGPVISDRVCGSTIAGFDGERLTVDL
jgi:hypothetical protein